MGKMIRRLTLGVLWAWLLIGCRSQTNSGIDSGEGIDAVEEPKADLGEEPANEAAEEAPMEVSDASPETSDVSTELISESGDGEYTEFTPCAGSGSVGPLGGILEFCDARLKVPAGALESELVVQVERIAPEGSPPFEFGFASDAFRFSPEEQVFSMPVEIAIPYLVSAPRTYPAIYYQGSWNVIEPCGGEGSRARFFVGRLGAFTLVYDLEDFSNGLDGLGGGTVQVQLDSDSYWFDLDASASYGIYTPNADGSYAVKLLSFLPVADGAHYLNIDFTVTAQGQCQSVAQAYVYLWLNSEYVVWQYIIAIHPAEEASLDLTSSTDYQLQGVLNAIVHLGSDDLVTKQFTANLDVTLGKWRWPMEASCGY